MLSSVSTTVITSPINPQTNEQSDTAFRFSVSTLRRPKRYPTLLWAVVMSVLAVRTCRLVGPIVAPPADDVEDRDDWSLCCSKRGTVTGDRLLSPADSDDRRCSVLTVGLAEVTNEQWPVTWSPGHSDDVCCNASVDPVNNKLVVNCSKTAAESHQQRTFSFKYQKNSRQRVWWELCGGV